MDDDDDLRIVYESYGNGVSTAEDDDDDIKIVYESIDYEEWKMARDILRDEYNIDIETGLPIRREPPKDGNGHVQQIQQPTTQHGTSSHLGTITSSRFPPASSKSDAAVRSNQDQRARTKSTPGHHPPSTPGRHPKNSRTSSTTCTKRKRAGAEKDRSEIRVRAFDVSALRQRLKSLASSNKTPEGSRKRKQQEMVSSERYVKSPFASSAVVKPSMAQRTQREPLMKTKESAFPSHARH